MDALQKGRDSYATLAATCDELVASGNWQRIGASDIRLFLDMYVQVLVLRMAENADLTEQLQRFAAEVPSRDVLRLGRIGKEAAVAAGYKNRAFAEGTPLLLRCCIAMDDKEGTEYAYQFLNGITHLLYAAAEADGSMNDREMQFITTYIGGLRTFLMSRESGKYSSRLSSGKPFLPSAETSRREKKEKPASGSQSAVSADQAEQKNQAQSETDDSRSLDELLAELDGLIGLAQVKKEVHDLVNLIKVRELRRKSELKVMDMSFHMVFTGNPGTGKTTVARLIAKIYKKLGFLSKGQFVETDRSGLVAGYVGQTAGKVTEVVNGALGGILFIDEAYALARKGMENDFGREAIDTLVKLMEDHRDDFLVIVAGYTDEMHDFLTSNPGLISRFNKYIDFPDYTDDELMEILLLMAAKQDYSLSEDAQGEVRKRLQLMSISERLDFGNARGIRNTLEKLVQAQANRIVADEACQTKEKLMEIGISDVHAAFSAEEPASEKTDSEQTDAGAASPEDT